MYAFLAVLVATDGLSSEPNPLAQPDPASFTIKSAGDEGTTS